MPLLTTTAYHEWAHAIQCLCLTLCYEMTSYKCRREKWNFSDLTVTHFNFFVWHKHLHAHQKMQKLSITAIRIKTTDRASCFRLRATIYVIISVSHRMFPSFLNFNSSILTFFFFTIYSIYQEMFEFCRRFFATFGVEMNELFR